ncbi:hypothetical protein PG988_011997 [Apiospora saccharicola]
MSIGRFQAGLAHASQELTVAAANFNIDFTLMKFEAPAEYQAIGNLLTPSRVREAENGPIHVTVRKLGALSDGVCPDTPNLIKAYGIRASEITQEVSDADSGSAGHSLNWIRKEFGGIDATSIWAVSTSCIAVPSAFVTAAQQEITRDHLKMWDASARAWLQTADKARQLQYKQVLLIIKNLSIAIHEQNVSLYSNVISVWESALTATEGLVSGKPHAVQNGPVLLGLSAWHIFPDMLVFNGPKGNMEVPMNDPLVRPGGVLSLGISDPVRMEKQGVYWSLSLSHHMYYGEAVRRTRRLDIDGSRLTLNGLILVFFGSLLRCWNIPKQGIDKSLKILQEIKRVMPVEARDCPKCWPRDRSDATWRESREEKKKIEQAEQPIHTYNKGCAKVDWRQVIEQPLQAYASGDKEAALAVSWGRRRPAFLPGPLTAGRKPLFGLLRLSELLYLLKEPDNKVEFLRRLASRVPGLNNTNSIILSVDTHPSGGTSIQFATVFPFTSENGSCSVSNSHAGNHRRWIHVPDYIRSSYFTDIQRAKDEVSRAYEVGGNDFDAGMDQVPSLGRYCTEASESVATGDFEADPELALHGGSGGPEIIVIDNSDTEPEQGGVSLDFLARQAFKRSAQAKYRDLCANHLTQQERQLKPEAIEYLGDKQGLTWKHDKCYDVVTFKGNDMDSYGRFFGNEAMVNFLQLDSLIEPAGVYVKGEGNAINPEEENIGPAPGVTLDDILWRLEHGLIDSSRLEMLIEGEPAFSFLKVLAAVREIYGEPAAEGSTISGSIVERMFDPPIFSKKLGKDDWTTAASHLVIDQSTAIALISYFEMGNNMIDGLKGNYNIVGLSGGDSIFVLTAILSDPEVTYPDYSFTRILGNTGKAGFSILTSPSDLMVRKMDPSAWRVESTTFDGEQIDHFSRTSMHLGFTNWQAPLFHTLSTGQRDADVNIIESVVSIRDAGKWVADVDIYRALLNDRLERQGEVKSCEHVTADGVRKADKIVGEIDDELMSVETWDQVLDDVDGSAVVRCFDNRVARLAIISVLSLHSQANGRAMLICSKKPCWKCLAKSGMHRPIIRINPKEIHIVDPNFYDTSYAGSGRKRDKWDWIIRSFGVDESVIGTLGHDEHRVRRAALSPYFSKQSAGPCRR